ncbi:DUF1499 domain-containing protein [Roseococcus sp. SDR]|uniref:DUF1499 domain-containing protein n=1 Tax=Roseococcus sp. SDR TaxID=2835532 RepID=UPI001BD1307C|nr:DUF1499 domain-containing protein [Roseococcus sp. SDR]MBS7790998.1 DUF1499 domain-containing protein [Roseococcus sp. SDR]MBV1846312.1 DUF1499 domain-containing protein [Roseococcus sp. SDR]
MSGLSALLGQGPNGLEGPSPVEFASLVPPPSPNACLAAPASHPGPKQVVAPTLPGTPDAVFERLLALAKGFPRTWQLAAWPERRQAQWVERSALNFPDIIVAECVATPEGSSLFLYSRRLLGPADFGASRRRVERWLGALEALAAEAAPEPPPLPPSRFAARAIEAAQGQRVLLAWGDARETPEITLRALAAGAVAVQVMSAERPDQADALLLEAGQRLGLTAEAEAVVEARAAARDPLPPPLHADPGAWRAWWMRGSLDAPDLRERLPEVDLVLDGADLARLDGDPPRRLRGLAATGGRRLILRSSVVPATPDLAALGFDAWHAGELDAARAAALDAALQAHGITLPQFAAFPGRLTREAAEAAGLAAPWWWFIGEAALEEWLGEAGWRIQERERDGIAFIVTAIA